MPTRPAPLVSAAELALLLGQPDVAVVDCRFDLARPAAGRDAHARGHIPGAVYAHLDDDLSAAPSPSTGRHPLPDPQRLAARLGAWGIDRSTRVVAYDAGNGAIAARLWWLLRWLGSDAGAVLDGGFAAWERDGFPVSTAVPAAVPRTFTPALRPELAVDAAAVAGLARSAEARVLDVRAAERFAGTVEPLDPVAGHIPGARNLPFADLLGPDGRFLPRDTLRERLQQALGGIPAERTVAMCGSGVTACHLLVALEAAGLPGARLYPGSWSEWIRDPRRPVATGTDSGPSPPEMK